MTGLGLMIAAALVAIGDWAAVAREDRRAEYVLKPLALALLVAAAIFLRHGDPPLRVAFTVAALVLSLTGDVFLMLPRDAFVAGLGSFLLAHACYVVAFNAPPLNGVAGLVVTAAAAGVALAATPVYLRLKAGIVRSGRTEMLAPVTLYAVAICAMVVFALLTVARPDWTAGRSALAAAGALLFISSDGMIGWSRFVGDFRGSRVLILVTYHLGQMALLLGLLGVG